MNNGWDVRFTPEGLKRLGKIVRQARGSLSYRQFEQELGGEPSHATLWRLEHGIGKDPDLSVLEKIAPLTPYSLEELLAIAGVEPTQRYDVQPQQTVTAEDAWVIIEQLPDSEKSRLGQMLFAYFGSRQTIQNNETGNSIPLTSNS